MPALECLSTEDLDSNGQKMSGPCTQMPCSIALYFRLRFLPDLPPAIIGSQMARSVTFSTPRSGSSPAGG